MIMYPVKMQIVPVAQKEKSDFMNGEHSTIKNHYLCLFYSTICITIPICIFCLYFCQKCHLL